MTELADAIRHAVSRSGDPERAIQQQRYMKSALPYQGLTVPELRRLLGPVIRPAVDEPTWQGTIRDLWDAATVREHRYAALAVARRPWARPYRTPDTMALWRHLVVTGAWWDLVDEIASHLVGDVLQRYPTEVTPIVVAWAADDRLWLRRTAIICQLRRGVDTDRELLATTILANVGAGEDFFIRKAIGWALRQYASTDSDWVKRFVEVHRHELAPLSIKEASKRLG